MSLELARKRRPGTGVRWSLGVLNKTGVGRRIWEGAEGKEVSPSSGEIFGRHSAASWDALRYLAVSFLATDAIPLHGVGREFSDAMCPGFDGGLYVLDMSFAGGEWDEGSARQIAAYGMWDNEHMRDGNITT